MISAGHPTARSSCLTACIFAVLALPAKAGGTALEALDLPMEPHLRFTSAIVLLVAGAVVPMAAAIEWARSERAMREHMARAP